MAAVLSHLSWRHTFERGSCPRAVIPKASIRSRLSCRQSTIRYRCRRLSHPFPGTWNGLQAVRHASSQSFLHCLRVVAIACVILPDAKTTKTHYPPFSFPSPSPSLSQRSDVSLILLFILWPSLTGVCTPTTQERS